MSLIGNACNRTYHSLACPAVLIKVTLVSDARLAKDFCHAFSRRQSCFMAMLASIPRFSDFVLNRREMLQTVLSSNAMCHAHAVSCSAGSVCSSKSVIFSLERPIFHQPLQYLRAPSRSNLRQRTSSVISDTSIENFRNINQSAVKMHDCTEEILIKRTTTILANLFAWDYTLEIGLKNNRIRNPHRICPKFPQEDQIQPGFVRASWIPLCLLIWPVDFLTASLGRKNCCRRRVKSSSSPTGCDLTAVVCLHIAKWTLDWKLQKEPATIENGLSKFKNISKK